MLVYKSDLSANKGVQTIREFSVHHIRKLPNVNGGGPR